MPRLRKGQKVMIVSGVWKGRIGKVVGYNILAHSTKRKIVKRYAYAVQIPGTGSSFAFHAKELRVTM